MSGNGIVKTVKPDEHSGQYCAQVYYTTKLREKWYYCHIVVTKDLEMCLAVTKRKYLQQYDIAVPITFDGDYIALGIPDDGVQTDNGWEIVPVQKPYIEKDRVDNFSSEKSWVPECVLLLQWLPKDKTPEPLHYKLRLLGTGNMNDFFRIIFHPGQSLTLQSAVVQTAFPHPHLLQQTHSAHYELSKTASFAHENRQVIRAKFATFQGAVHDMLRNEVDADQFRLFVKSQFPPGDCIPPPPAGWTEIFEAITRHGLWDYYHCSPLVHIVQRFGNCEMKERAQIYKQDLKAYIVVATLEDYIEADLEVADPPPAKRAKYDPHYHLMKWENPLIGHTLGYLDQVWDLFSYHYLVPDYPPTALVDRVYVALEEKEPELSQQKETPPFKALLGPDTDVFLPTVTSKALEESNVAQKKPAAIEPPIFSVGLIQGVEVIGMTEFTLPSHGINFEWKGYGMKLHVLEGSLPGGMGECRVNIRVSLSGQFQLPEGTDLLSPVFWISAPCKFTKPVTLEIQHCALRENEAVLSDLSFVSAMCSQKDLPYRFKQLDEGVFTMHSSYGSIQLSHFSGKAITGRKSTPRLYCARLYHTIEQIYDWRFSLVITQDLPVFNTVVENHCHKVGAKLDDISLEVEFQQDEITLDFPEGQVKEGWEITPRSRPVITKRKVDMFKEGQSIPQCQLMMEWKKKGEVPTRLVYKIVLKGTSASNDNYLLLVLDPAEAPTNGMQDLVPGSQEKPTIPDKPELKDLKDALNKLAHRWIELGISLKISMPKLNSIETSSQHNPERCLLKMLDTWLQQQVDPPPRWGNIIDAVESLGDLHLGRELRLKYGI